MAIAVGVIVSWLGGRGVTLMGSQPQLVAGLLVGTVLGVALFRRSGRRLELTDAGRTLLAPWLKQDGNHFSRVTGTEQKG